MDQLITGEVHDPHAVLGAHPAGGSTTIRTLRRGAGEVAVDTETGKVTGVVVAMPFGRGVVLAKTVIDATGNADIADCALTGIDFPHLRRAACEQQNEQNDKDPGHGRISSM